MKKRILLVDRDDSRRETRVMLLVSAGYEVEVSASWAIAEGADHEGRFDLVILSLHYGGPQEALDYSDKVAKENPTLPVLLLMDTGVFVPRDTLSRSIETGLPVEMLQTIAEMLAGSRHIRELEQRSA